MDGERDGATSARPRREWRLRSWWRHEQQSVRMALSAPIHHSFDKVAADELNNGPRAQKTDRAGTRPGVLKDPEPHGAAVTVGPVAAEALLVVASLAGGDGVDATTVSFLLFENLQLQKEEEEERKRQREVAEYEAWMRALDRRVDANEQLTRARVLRTAQVGRPPSRAAGQVEEEEEEEEETAEDLLLSAASCSRCSHVETWTAFSTTAGTCS